MTVESNGEGQSSENVEHGLDGGGASGAPGAVRECSLAWGGLPGRLDTS